MTQPSTKRLLTESAGDATYLARSTKTVADPGAASDANLVLTGMNRTSSGGTAGVIRGEAQGASLVLNNNVGVDLSLTRAYEAIKFTTPSVISTMGSAILRIKKTAALNGNATLTANIYTDNAGVPGTLIALNNGSTVVYGSKLSSAAYTAVGLLLRNSVVASTSYWIVLTTAGLGAEAFILDTAATGSGAHAHSTNGTAWTATTSKPYLEVRGQTIAGVQGTSENYVAVRGDSTTYYGVYGNTNSGIGVHGGSVSGYGVEGISETGVAGVVGIGQNGYGVKGDGTNNYGVYGSSSNAGGVRGDSVSSLAGVYGTNNQTTGAGMQGENTANGDGVLGRNTNGTGYGVHSDGYFRLTHGWGFVTAPASGLGTAPPALVTTGVDAVHGKITFGTGTTPSAGDLIVFAFPGGRPCPNAPLVFLQPLNDATAQLRLFPTSVGVTGFTVTAGVAPAASQANTVYAFSFVVIA